MDITASVAELKPCPFCGLSASLEMPTEVMVERAASAIANASYAAIHGSGIFKWDTMRELIRDEYRALARAALTAGRG